MDIVGVVTWCNPYLMPYNLEFTCKSLFVKLQEAFHFTRLFMFWQSMSIALVSEDLLSVQKEPDSVEYEAHVVHKLC